MEAELLIRAVAFLSVSLNVIPVTASFLLATFVRLDWYHVKEGYITGWRINAGVASAAIIIKVFYEMYSFIVEF